MEDNIEQANNGLRIDPYELDQEKEKWKKRATYVIVIIIRILVAGVKFLLGMLKAVGKEMLRIFKLIP